MWPSARDFQMFSLDTITLLVPFAGFSLAAFFKLRES